VQLGAFTATWGDGRCILSVPTEPLCREILERTGFGPPARAWSWDELRRIAGVISRAAEDFGSVQIPAAVPGSWECPSCGIVFEVPAGHHGPVLCGRHSPPEQMRLAAPCVATGTIFADQVASGALTWDRPDSDPLGDLQQARRLMEQYAAAHPDPDRTVGDIVGALSGVGLCASAVISGDLTPAQYAAVEAAMEQWHRAQERAAARRPPRSSRQRRLRTRQVLDDAEALIARLDGEGYAVVDKARREEAAAGTLPPDYLDTGAMSWHRGDPAL
jgi:hypothetical protein